MHASAATQEDLDEDDEDEEDQPPTFERAPTLLDSVHETSEERDATEQMPQTTEISKDANPATPEASPLHQLQRPGETCVKATACEDHQQADDMQISVNLSFRSAEAAAIQLSDAFASPAVEDVVTESVGAANPCAEALGAMRTEASEGATSCAENSGMRCAEARVGAASPCEEPAGAMCAVAVAGALSRSAESAGANCAEANAGVASLSAESAGASCADANVGAVGSCAGSAVARCVLTKVGAARLFAASVGATGVDANAGVASSSIETAGAKRADATVGGVSVCAESVGAMRRDAIPDTPYPPAETTDAKLHEASPQFRLIRKQPPRDTKRGRQEGSSVDINTLPLSVSSPTKAMTLPMANALAPPARSQSTVIRAAIGHMLSPTEQGWLVLVEGDGWGGGSGSYFGTVTEADANTFTVIRHGNHHGDRRMGWEETHVLRKHCRIRPRGASPTASERASDTDNGAAHSTKRRRL